MGELRLYAIAIDEVRGMFGASPERRERLRGIAGASFAPTTSDHRYGLLGKLGPIFRRVPAAPVVSPTAPRPDDVERLVTGQYILPDRTGASWRVLEILVQGSAWGATTLGLDRRAIDDLDFALARGGVSAAVGVRHLLSASAQLTLLPVQGLTVGYHPYDTALAMAAAYRAAVDDVKTEEQRDVVAALTAWLDDFPHWAEQAEAAGRPAPDMVGFWTS